MIFVAFIIVALVVIYAILYQVVIEQRYVASECHETAEIKIFQVRKKVWLAAGSDRR